MYLDDVQYGISTKGSGRGYGMKNMRKIADRYNIKLEEWIEKDQYIVSINL